jgi:hypothetical protein
MLPHIAARLQLVPSRHVANINKKVETAMRQGLKMMPWMEKFYSILHS